MKIEYWSDIACPFCYIGANRMKNVLEELNLTNDMRFRSFPLDPSAPKFTTQSFIDHLTGENDKLQKQAMKQIKMIENMARQDNLKINLSEAKFTNTMDAHRLIQYAQSQRSELASKLISKFYRDFFVKGKIIADKTVITNSALEVGFKLDEIQNVLSSQLFEEEVFVDKELARKHEIQKLPYFIVDGKYIINGIHTYHTYKSAIEKIIKKENRQ